MDGYMDRILREDEGEQFGMPLTEEDPDFAEIREGVIAALEEAERGEGRLATEVFAELRARHGLPD